MPDPIQRASYLHTTSGMRKWVVFRPVGWEGSPWCLLGDAELLSTWKQLQDEATAEETQDTGVVVRIVKGHPSWAAGLVEFGGF